MHACHASLFPSRHARRALAWAVLSIAAAGPGAAQCAVTTLEPGDGSAFDEFGQAVAVGPDRVLVGCPKDDDLGTDSGSVYVYDGRGVFLGKLLAADGSAHDWFGDSLDVSGTTALVGARDDDQNGAGAGSAYLFDVVTGTQLHKLLPSDAEAGDAFGWRVAIDGGRAVVGSPLDGKLKGALYVFDVASGAELHKLTPSDGGDLFPSGVDISGNLILAGSRFKDGTGAAYVFDATTGTELLKLAPGELGDNFGYGVALDGSLALVAAPGDDDQGENTGALYAFEVPSGVLQYKITLPGTTKDSFVGSGVAADAGRALVATIGIEAVHVFDLATGRGLQAIRTAVGASSVGLSGPWGAVGLPTTGPSGQARLLFAAPLRAASYCGPAALNSRGLSGVIAADGCSAEAAGDLRLVARGLPFFQSGYFLASATQGFVPFAGGSQGNLCLGGNLGRFAAQAGDTGAAGELRLQVDLDHVPTDPPTAVQPGETWNFQAWYHDQNPMPTSNFTDGVAVMFF